eukprot:GDKJ01022967.1.p1 GENE.GDKJ01022967.1~~GDKJ01022967.1.p1  ORF type:complete len:363 (-),score=81.27 GDKJ01022967.1:207-1295(-)
MGIRRRLFVLEFVVLMSSNNPRINLPRFSARETLNADSKLPIIGRYCILASAALTFIVAMIHLCTLPVKLSFPADGASFVSDENKYSFRLSLFSLTPQTLIDAWTPFGFFLIVLLGQTEQFKCNLALKDFLRYSIFHLLMILFGNFPYAGGIGIIFGIINFLMWPFFCVLAFKAPGEEASFNVYLGFKDLAPAEDTANPNNVASKTVGGNNSAVNAKTGDFPVVNRQPESFPVVHQSNNGFHNNPLGQYGAGSTLHVSNSSKNPVTHTNSNNFYNSDVAGLEANGVQRVPSNSVLYSNNNNNGPFNSMHGAHSHLQQSSQQMVGNDHTSHHSSHLHRMQNAQQQAVQKPAHNNVYGMAMTGF